jgi:hypothetical protein
MAKIKVTDMKLTEESLEQVKGGPVYMKLGDIKGESSIGSSTGGGGGAGKVKFDRLSIKK